MSSSLSTMEKNLKLDLDRLTDPRRSRTSLLSINDEDSLGVYLQDKMPLEGSYAIWNNRGGSGKTNLTYHLAIKYAYRNPDKTVLVVDMCPQTDLSHAFLGDDEQGQDYLSQICSLKKDPMILENDQRVPKTIAGYLDLYSSVGIPLSVDPRTFLFNVSKFNNQLPRNVYLLCGDPSLELVGKALEQKRSSTSITSFANPWRTITQSLRAFVHKIGERRGIKLMTFIDTNSSFSISTEIALTAADRILLPVTEDHLHRNGFEYLFSLLYGFSQPSSIYYYYRHFSFYYRADENGVKLPKIHLILCKLSAIPSKNHDMNQYWHSIYEIYVKHRDAFESRTFLNNHFNHHSNESPSSTSTGETFDDFLSEYVMHISHESNVVSRLAVKSHSPLLAVKHAHPSSDHHYTAQSFDKILNDIVERI